jgi:hypothetical protein
MSQLVTHIVLPAYNNAHHGLLIDLTVHAYPSSRHTVTANGKIAECLQKNFQRVIYIASSINPTWRIFKNYSYVISSSFTGGEVRETASSSLGLCIGLLNLYREINHQQQIGGITGTGILRVDGCFDTANRDGAKKEAAMSSDVMSRYFITPEDCRHLFDLDYIMETL